MDALLEALEARLRERPGRAFASPPDWKLRASAVLLPLVERDAQPHVVFTRRPQSLKHHGGQISFPGGAEDPSDANAEATALRELEEELGVPRARVRVLGTLDALPTVTDFRIQPFVGALARGTQFTPSASEVAEVIEVPLAHLLRPDTLRIEQRLWRGVLHDVHAFDYQQHTIWGATGRILFNFLDVARDLPAFQELLRP